MAAVTPVRWNHNIHYHRLLLGALPPRCKRALDVGCGEGIVARELRQRVADVSAIDIDQRTIELARQQDVGGEIDYIVGDFLSFPFARETFDFVISVAALHHMDQGAALQRMSELLRPGGTIAVLGLIRSHYPRDLARDAAAHCVSYTHRLVKQHWESSAATLWPPPTLAETRRVAQRVLPGVRVRRHLLWRYSLVWNKPATVTAVG